jgi:formylglycine-generating enzyme required for sulfatase activity
MWLNSYSHPVVNVSAEDADAFCAWAGLQLPTEQQWEKAARGTDGRIYPWGNQPPGKERTLRCNWGDSYAWIHDGYEYTAPVGSYPSGASPYGALDMAGNVWEWTSSLYGGGPLRVFRGGSWNDDAEDVRCAFRSAWPPDDSDDYLGFRPSLPLD